MKVWRAGEPQNRIERCRFGPLIHDLSQLYVARRSVMNIVNKNGKMWNFTYNRPQLVLNFKLYSVRFAKQQRVFVGIITVENNLFGVGNGYQAAHKP